jgi:nitrogen fixation-related uncharacterized protein
MISPSRVSTLLQPVLVLMLGLFILLFLWGIMSHDDYEDDDFTVTITYDCERVLHDRNYPGEVLKECLDLRDEIKRRNH